MDQLLLNINELQMIQQETERQRKIQLDLLEQYKRLDSLSSLIGARRHSQSALEALLSRQLLERDLQDPVIQLLSNRAVADSRSSSAIDELLRVAVEQRLLDTQTDAAAAPPFAALQRASPPTVSIAFPAFAVEATKDQTPTRKRQADPFKIEQAETRQPKKQCRAPGKANREAPAVAHTPAKQKKKAAPVTKIAVKDNGFPLPSLSNNQDINSLRMVNLTGSKKAWKGIKTEGMRKEIFLRRLYAGKIQVQVPSLKSSSLPRKKRGKNGKA